MERINGSRTLIDLCEYILHCIKSYAMINKLRMYTKCKVRATFW